MDTPIERLESSLDVFEIFDPENDNPEPGINYKRMPQNWIRIVTSLRTQKQLTKYLKRHMDFNVYVFLSRNPARLPGDTVIVPWTNKFKDLGIEKDDSAINLVITDTISRNIRIHAPTAWMILHMMCHVIYEEFGPDHWDDHWFSMLEKIYGKEYIQYIDDTQDTVDIMNNIFTFRSARTHQIFMGNEGIIELMVDSIIHDKPSRKQFPILEQSDDRDEDVYPVSEEKAKKIWGKFIDDFGDTTHQALTSIKGEFILT